MGKRLLSTIYRFRWAIACAALVACVACELSGSSIGLLVTEMGGSDGTLFGTPRSIRSDEFAVFTPMALSQCATDGAFPYVNDAFRGTATDMFCVYGQPVWDIAVLFRPFQWGYLLLGAERGLSFFWCARLIALFMVSFEFGDRILTRSDHGLALLYALFVALSPVVQWWFSTNALVEMLVFGQVALLFLNGYLDTGSYRGRTLYALGIAWCLTVFVLALYPAWQVPLAYVFGGAAVALLVEKLPRTRKGAKDVLLCILVIVLMAASLAYVALKSWDTIVTVMNTAYPGHRNDAGGGAGRLLLAYPLWIVAPFVDSGMGVAPNACEGAGFFTALPSCALLPLLIMLRRKKADALWTAFIIAAALLGLYVVVGLPEALATGTLLGKSTAARAAIGCELALMMLLFSSLDRITEVPTRQRAVLLLVSVSTMLVALFALHPTAPLRFQAIAAGLTSLFFLCALFADRSCGRKALCATGIAIALLSGAAVNPVTVGTSDHRDTAVADLALAQNEDGNVWAVIDEGWHASNYLAGLGLSTITSTNTYPQLATWRSLSQDAEDEALYDRYAHILFELKDAGAAAFELKAPDVLKVILTAEELKGLGVDRLLSTDPDLARFSSQSAPIELLGGDGERFVYSLG